MTQATKHTPTPVVRLGQDRSIGGFFAADTKGGTRLVICARSLAHAASLAEAAGYTLVRLTEHTTHTDDLAYYER
jgi:hypothetical protein